MQVLYSSNMQSKIVLWKVKNHLAVLSLRSGLLLSTWRLSINMPLPVQLDQSYNSNVCITISERVGLSGMQFTFNEKSLLKTIIDTNEKSN